jgi:hypothetical protein
MEGFSLVKSGGFHWFHWFWRGWSWKNWWFRLDFH